MKIATARNKVKTGEWDAAGLQAALERGEVLPTDLVWISGWDTWRKLSAAAVELGIRFPASAHNQPPPQLLEPVKTLGPAIAPIGSPSCTEAVTPIPEQLMAPFPALIRILSLIPPAGAKSPSPSPPTSGPNKNMGSSRDKYLVSFERKNSASITRKVTTIIMVATISILTSACDSVLDSIIGNDFEVIVPQVYTTRGISIYDCSRGEYGAPECTIGNNTQHNIPSGSLKYFCFDKQGNIIRGVGLGEFPTGVTIVPGASLRLKILCWGEHTDVAKIGFGFSSDEAPRPSNLSTETNSAPPMDLFDPGVEEQRRLRIVKNFLQGAWYLAPGETSLSLRHTNLDLDPRGDFRIFECLMYGEESERSYELKHSGSWSVSAERYSNTGRIYYHLNLETSPGKNIPTIYIVDRSGFLAKACGNCKPEDLARGNRRDCPSFAD